MLNAKYSNFLLATVLFLVSLPVSGDETASNNPVVHQGTDYPSRRLDAPITFSGQPDLWRGQAVPLFLASPDHVSMPDWQGPDDVNITVYLLWDDKALYLAAQVHDRQVSKQQRADQLWRGSGFQIAFDPLDDTLLPGYDGNDIEIGFGKLADNSDVAYGWVGGVAGTSGLLEDIKVLVTDLSDSERFYEVAIPWQRLAPFTPQSGRHFGFNILYNIARNGERLGWLHWTPGIGEEKLAFLYRNVKLVDAKTGQGEAAIATDRNQYSSGDAATVFVYLPTDYAGQAEIHMTVSQANGTEVDKLTQTVATLAGGTSLRIPYEIGRLRGDGLSVTVETSWDEAKVTLKSEFANLSPERLLSLMDELENRNKLFRQRLLAAAESGLSVDYPRVTAAVVDITLKTRQADLGNDNLVRRFGLLPKIRQQLQFLSQSLDQAETELQALESGDIPVRPLSNPVMSQLKIHSGSFWQGEEPVLLVGPLGWWDTFKDLDLIKEIGFNIVSGTLVVADAVPEPGKPRFDYIRNIAKQIDICAEKNLAFDFLPSPHPVPDAWKQQFPALTTYPSGGWIGASLYEDTTRQMIDEYWAVLLPPLKDKPNLVSLDLVNEWSFNDGRRHLHPQMQQRFIDYLRQRYGDITTLNQAWQSHETAFQDINPLKIPRQTPGAYYDWESFRRQEGLENLTFLRETARKYAPQVATQVKSIAATDLSMDLYDPVGVERELRGDIFEIAGSDCAATVHLDYYRSLIPDKPAADTEFHVSTASTPAETSADLWSAMLHGEGMRLYFAWTYWYSAEILAAGALLHNPPALQALGRSVLDVRRNAAEIVCFQQKIPQAEIGLLYSPASLYCDPDYPARLRQTHAILNRQDAGLRFISERQLAAGKFAQLKLIVIAAAPYLETTTPESLQKFIDQGGQVVSSGIQSAAFCDPYGRKLIMPPTLQFFPQIDSTVCDTLLSKSAVTRLVRSGSGQIELRSLQKDDATVLIYAINYGQEINFAPEIDNQPIPQAFDRISWQTVKFPVILPARAVMLLEVKR